MGGRYMINGAIVKPILKSDEFDLTNRCVPRAERDRKAPPFSEVLKESIVKVNALQLDADNLTNRLALGEVEDISEVSIAVEKAELALRMMVQIRDKMLDAYTQISRMTA
jgi:flagellar hook-basal body complex protein FliE